MLRSASAFILTAAVVFGQAGFESATTFCSAATFPTPCGTAGDAEGVSMTVNASGYVSVDNVANGAGFPAEGSNYGRIRGAGPAGGGGTGNVMYIPIPVGATSVAFYWDFYNAEGNSATWTDGMEIDVIGVCGGPQLASLVFVNTVSWTGGAGVDGSGCASFYPETAPDGPNTFQGALPVGGAYLRVSVWNGGDNAFASDGVIDGVCFDCTLPPPDCILYFSSPVGPGSLMIENTPCAARAGNFYLFAVTFAAGAFPNGWWFGLDIPFADLVAQYVAGFPFAGALDGLGASSLGPIGGLPSGFQIWAVTVQFTPGFGVVTEARAPQTYVIP